MSTYPIIITSPENITYTEPLSGYFPGTYGFEDEPDGDRGTSIKFITGMSASSYCIIYPNYSNHTKILEFQSTGDSQYAFHYLSSQTAGIVEFYVNFDEINEDHTIGLYESMDPSDGAIQLSWRNNGYLSYYDGTWNDIEPYTLNNWYHVKIEFNISNDWHLWIDNNKKDISGFSYYGSPSYIQYYWIEGSSTADIKLDAIGYSWDPYYSIGNNLNEGLLLNYTTEIDLDWKAYSLNNQQNVTIPGTTIINFPDDGVNSIKIFGKDSLGNNYSSDIKYFSIDFHAPTSMISYTPYRDPNIVIKSTIFTLTANDGLGSGVSLIRYKINDSSWINYTGVFNLSAYNYGDYRIFYQAIDEVNHIENEKSLIVTLISETSETTISGYNIVLLIALFASILVYLQKKKFKI
ncbi:MAG: hypothetical protein JSV62_04300 [Promethearchaeota archaeon]|nr:MAG: hypothetical protein JSV62_04300 [Candidatus Lokiarchaeota archaeon]